WKMIRQLQMSIYRRTRKLNQQTTAGAIPADLSGAEHKKLARKQQIVLKMVRELSKAGEKGGSENMNKWPFPGPNGGQ
ncbi:MAG: hypothetical protein J7M21_01640, partial [Planctomycetes bacterium]|nr:hypothetical protein [Planctomycetota bacterium]